MIILVCAWAPSREIAMAFMAAVGIAELRDGILVPLIEVQIDEIGPITKTQEVKDEAGNVITPAVVIPGWHVNVRYFDATAEALTQGLAQVDDDGRPLSLFVRTRILDLIDARTGERPTWNANAPPLPAGYVNADGVRLYDSVTLKTPSRVWA